MHRTSSSEGGPPELKSVTWLASRNPAAADLSYLVFFHSSNKGCTASLDALRDLSNKLGSKLRIIIITQEDSEKSPRFSRPTSPNESVWHSNHDKVFGSFGVDFVPFSVLIDAKNRVLWMGNPQSMTSSFIQKIVQ